jgi:hypothetical protein
MVTSFDDLEPKNLVAEKQKVAKEYRIQVAIVDHVMGRKTGNKAFNAFICHIYQGRSKEEGFFLKQLGVVAGVADLLVIWRGGMGFLEVKKPDGRASTPQRKFEGICTWLKVNYAIVRSVKEAHDTLVGWGCPMLHSFIKEANLLTKEEIHALHRE